MSASAIAVLGAGSWGTALAWLLGDKGEPVRLWCRDSERAAAMQAVRENPAYLPGLLLPPSIEITDDLTAALTGARLVVIAVPTQAVRQTVRAIAGFVPGVPLVLAAKGLERDTGLRLSEVVAAELLAARVDVVPVPASEARQKVAVGKQSAAPGDNATQALRPEGAGEVPLPPFPPSPALPVAVLSGPNLSGEIVQRIPTATVAAAADPELARDLQETFGTAFFRVYTNIDIAGVELGGALKNPIAIAAGMCDGLGFGSNTRASLLTRGLAEITRLGVAAGGQAATFAGLSGLGDLIATAHSPLSRNYRVGLALGRGDTLEHAREALHQVAEGVPTTEAACRLAASLGVEVPILEELRQVLFHGRPLEQAVRGLLSRPYRDESPA